MRELILFMFGMPIFFALGLAFFVCSYHAIIDMSLIPFNPFEWSIVERKVFAITWLTIQACFVLSWISAD